MSKHNRQPPPAPQPDPLAALRVPVPSAELRSLAAAEGAQAAAEEVEVAAEQPPPAEVETLAPPPPSAPPAEVAPLQQWRVVRDAALSIRGVSIVLRAGKVLTPEFYARNQAHLAEAKVELEKVEG